MPIRPILGVLAGATLLFLSVPAWSERSQPPTPPIVDQSTAPEVAKARALMKERQYLKALTVLQPLARQRPIEPSVLFLIGLAAIEASQQPGVSDKARDALLDAAIAALRRMLVKDPGLIRVRLELARAFFLKGEDRLATRHFEQVLAGKPPAPVVLNVNRFLSQMRARKRWSLRLGMALAPDSNISARSDERTIVLDTPIGRLPFTFQAEDEAESGIGISVWAGGEYQYPLEDRWRLRAGADISRREYGSDEFDQMTVSGHVGPRWLIGRASEASLLANVRQHWLSDEAEYRDLGIRVEGRHRLNRRTTANLNASRYERRYDASTHLDGPLTEYLGGRRLGGDADGAYRHGGGLGEPEDGTRARAPHAALGAARRHGAPSLGLHRGRGRHAALDRLPGRLVSIRPGRRAAPRPGALIPAQRLQSRLHPGRVQPADLPGAGTTDLERTASQLQAPLRRAEIRAPVLTPWDSVSRSFEDHPGPWGRDKPPLPSWHGNAAMP